MIHVWKAIWKKINFDKTFTLDIFEFMRQNYMICLITSFYEKVTLNFRAKNIDLTQN